MSTMLTMSTIHLHLLGIAVFTAVGVVWAIATDTRKLRAERRTHMAARRDLHAQLKARGYHVTETIGRYGPLILDDEWNRLLAQLEATSPNEIRASHGMPSS